MIRFLTYVSVFKAIISRYEDGDESVLDLIKSYITASKLTQDQSKLHSTVSLGEPKYYVDGRAFLGPWGRPQVDGPALRSTTLIKFAKLYLKRGGQDAERYVREILYDGRYPSTSVIKGRHHHHSRIGPTFLIVDKCFLPSLTLIADLEYVANSWRDTSFDLWEEVNGHHFFTFAVIRRALADGASFARQMKDTGASDFYQLQFHDITPRLDLFLDDQKPHVILASRNWTFSNDKVCTYHDIYLSSILQSAIPFFC